MEEFEGLVAETVEFEIGYFSGKQSKKQWLIGDKDIVQMYETLKNIIFCYGVIGSSLCGQIIMNVTQAK